MFFSTLSPSPSLCALGILEREIVQSNDLFCLSRDVLTFSLGSRNEENEANSILSSRARDGERAMCSVSFDNLTNIGSEKSMKQ